MAIRTTERSTSTSTSKEQQARESARKPAQRGGSSQQATTSRLRAAFRDTMSEIKKVSWPDKQTTQNLTLLVIGMAVAFGILLGGIDAIFVRIWEAIPNV